MLEITALPVVVPLAVVAFVLLLWMLRRRDALTLPRVLLAIVTCVYGAGVIANTLLPISLGGESNPLPWTVFINLVPLAQTEPSDMLQNVVLFAPLGILLPLVLRVDSVLKVLLSGLIVSFVMEALQFVNAVFWHGGHIADINDLLSDTIGVLIGYGIFRALLLLPVAKRLASALTFPAKAAASSLSDPAADTAAGAATP